MRGPAIGQIHPRCPLSMDQRKLFKEIFNPFNLCATSVSVWFPVFPSVALGVSVSSLNDIGIYLRQAIEPTLSNGFTAMKLFELRVPFPLTFLTLFSAIGLIFNSKIHALLQAMNDELLAKQEDMLKGLEDQLNVLSSEDTIEEKKADTSREKRTPLIRPPQSLSPFNLSPLSMTIFVPVYKSHTALGILFHDLNYMGFSLLQALEPNDKIFSLFRFIHIQVPLALDLLILFFALGLFLNGAVNRVEQGAREEVIKEIKGGIQQLRRDIY